MRMNEWHEMSIAFAKPSAEQSSSPPCRSYFGAHAIECTSTSRRPHSAPIRSKTFSSSPGTETSSAMSFNYVVRSVGYALGSAIGGLILAAGTGPGHLFPDHSAYTTAALVGIGAMAITTLTRLALARRRSSETNP